MSYGDYVFFESVVFVVSVFFLIFIVHIFNRKNIISDIFSSVSSGSSREYETYAISDKKTVVGVRFSLIAESIVLSMVAVFLYCMYEDKTFVDCSFSSYFYTWLVTVVFLLFKLVSYYFIGNFIASRETIVLWVRTDNYVKSFLSFFIVPFAVLYIINIDSLFFSRLFVISVISVFLISLILTIVRIVKTFSFSVEAFFYLFLYLCVVEVMPVLLYVKGVISVN